MNKGKAKLIGAIRLSKFLALSEDEFKRYIIDTKANPWFKRLCYSAQMNLWGEPVSDFDASKFKQIKKTAAPDELDEIEILRRRMRMIAIRNETVKKVIEKVREIQQPYLKSGDKINLLPLTQVEIARILAIDHALVNKIVRNGYLLELKSGKTVKLRELFPSTRDVVRNQVEHIIRSEKQALSDEEIRKQLKSKVSRRLVAQCRQGLDISNSYARNRIVGIK